MLNKQVNKNSKQMWRGCETVVKRSSSDNFSMNRGADIINKIMSNENNCKNKSVITSRKIFRKDKNANIQLKDTTFKLRPDKKIVNGSDNVDMTVYEIHKKKMNEIENNRKNLKRMEKKLEELKKDGKNAIEIFNLEKKIKEIKNDEEEINYYYKTRDILFSYFTDDLDLSNPNRKSKKKLFKDYKKVIDGIDLDVKEGRDYSIDYNCRECGGEDLVTDKQRGEVICSDCGLVRMNDLDPDDPNSYPYNSIYSTRQIKGGEGEMNEGGSGSGYSYKKVNHFMEHISHMQADEKNEVPQKVIDTVKLEMKKNRITEIDLDGKITREFLKKHGLNRFYDCVYKIISLIQGKPPVKMEPQLKDQLCDMFNEIQEPYKKHCPKNRSSFLNYRFVLHKFCQLIDRDEYLEYFPLLKPGEKLKEQDAIWKKICEELDWQFIPSG